MKFYIIVLGMLLLSAQPILYAQTVTQAQFITNMVEKHNFSKQSLQKWFQQAKVRRSILRAMSRPGEAKPWYEYRELFVTPARIKAGKAFMRKHSKTLQRAHTTYGVLPEIIVAIIGVETSYGQNTGSFRVLDALNTLAFHYPRRADYFRTELEHFLLLCREEGLNPLTPKGSYAGAMGIGQFMPRSFRKFAVDFEGDGKRDIWNNTADAIGSVAHYLHAHGWQRDHKVILKATQARPDAVETLLNLEFKPHLTIRQLRQRGLRFYSTDYEDYKAIFFDLETEQGQLFWVGFQNFYVITRYNRSTRYAMAVYQLAQAIKRRN